MEKAGEDGGEGGSFGFAELLDEACVDVVVDVCWAATVRVRPVRASTMLVARASDGQGCRFTRTRVSRMSMILEMRLRLRPIASARSAWRRPGSRRRPDRAGSAAVWTPAKPLTTGISLTDDGAVEWMNINVATRRALVELINQVSDRYGLSREAAYALASVAADLRLSQVVDVPHPLFSAAIRLDIFDS